MNKHNYLLKFFKKFRPIINSLIIKNSKKLNINEKNDKKFQFISTKRLFVAFIVFLILCFSYLSVPVFYNKLKFQSEIKNQLLKRHDIKFIFSSDMKYNLFPWPSYTFDNVQIINNDNKLADVKKLKINLEIVNFFSVKSVKIKDIFLEGVKFDIYKKDLKFFFNLLYNDLSKSGIKIKNGYIFFKNYEDEVLLINKINQMDYYHDSKKIQNILEVENEIFNIPYYLEIFNDENKKKIFSKIKINILKSMFESQYDYSENTKMGLINIIANKEKSQLNLISENDKIFFKFFDKMKDLNFDFEATLYSKPFYLDLSGNIKRLDLDYLTDPNSILLQLLKTEIFNNQNLNISSIINAEKVLPYQKIIDLLLYININEGLIDIDDSKFSWSNFANFQISNSLVYLSNNNLILDGTVTIDIKNYGEIYKFFQTPRNFRKEIEKLDFVFSYNFDQEMINISNIKINNQINIKVGKILSRLVSQENILQNRIYLKNLINKAIKAYAG